jgi:hypothetical protein
MTTGKNDNGEEGNRRMLSLFALIVEYDRGTYIRQARAASAQAALRKAAPHLGDIVPPKARQRFVEGLAAEKVVAIEGIIGVWCASLSAKRRLVLVNIVRAA